MPSLTEDVKSSSAIGLMYYRGVSSGSFARAFALEAHSSTDFLNGEVL